jgi:hypothetical protein
MTVSLEVKSSNPGVRAERKSAALRVLQEFADRLPEFRLVAFFDDYDWEEIKLPWNLGPENRGFYTAINTKTFRGGWIWPQYLTNKIFGSDYWGPDDDRLFDHVIYLHGTTCADKTGMVMTFAHELQHFAQYGFKRELWAVGRLIPNLPKELIDSLGLNWPDIPHEREARIVAKAVATELCGPDAVKRYIDRKIRESESSKDIEDWRFSLTVDPTVPYELACETKRFFQRLRPHRQAVEKAFEEARSDAGRGPDYKGIDMSAYFDAS